MEGSSSELEGVWTVASIALSTVQSTVLGLSTVLSTFSISDVCGFDPLDGRVPMAPANHCRHG